MGMALSCLMGMGMGMATLLSLNSFYAATEKNYIRKRGKRP